MPSVNSSSVPMVFDSSPVMTPSLPTLSNASASRSPITESRLEIVATDAMSDFESTSRAAARRASPTASAAASMPRLGDSGLAPAATALRPSWTMAWASTVAVVVPSPATSLVLVATSFASCAPRFSKGSGSSISFAMLTPSLVMVGEPYFFSSTTLRPLGPSVTLTASARALTPRSSALRACSSNRSFIPIGRHLPLLRCHARVCLSQPPGKPRAPRPARPAGPGASLLDHGEDLVLIHNEILGAVDLYLSPRIGEKQHPVAHLHADRRPLAVLQELAGSDGHHLPLLRLLLGRVGEVDAPLRPLLPLDGLDNHPVAKRSQLHPGQPPHP